MGRACQNGSIYKAKISKASTAAYKPINLLHSVCQTATAERLLNALHTHPIIGPSNHFQPPFNKVAAIFFAYDVGSGYCMSSVCIPCSIESAQPKLCCATSVCAPTTHRRPSSAVLITWVWHIIFGICSQWSIHLI